MNLALQKAGGDRRRGAPVGRTTGFTIVEILIVVVILGILATIVIPRLSNATQVASENTLKEDLRIMRAQIQIYRFQHNEIMPGRNGGSYDADTLRRQMTMGTNIAGDTGTPGSPEYPYGPYLRQLLTNPLNSKSTVQIVAGLGELPEPDSSHGWMYQPETNSFVADMPGSDTAGMAYVNY
ncbi:MAG: prepilin-type N-terminal cleavage/methylation domain-containing protein [Phycisphaerae bacterium]|nr:prepilin-type N-terminal cleavage/methylation domain-containing protein [Phycisphaerae bacterium]